ncbi:hypothetical protein RE9414_48130 [Prescottella equi]|nr:hypothetical protein RE9414_48130 [Prescottella equi]
MRLIRVAIAIDPVAASRPFCCFFAVGSGTCSGAFSTAGRGWAGRGTAWVAAARGGIGCGRGPPWGCGRRMPGGIGRGPPGGIGRGPPGGMGRWAPG